ncbi:hypothetical protein B0J11DRAFT_580333 [Dendryphion nanum]|uniref:Zn(2)-C6 fungal-type domain-containing protein n=1 Tax=Dendryphion nanum TaxID=256645 RepID=A0A9P9DPU9_9PLEO|nr:hypothetical protein B0J11DRAFT_580333 [Dendryphion nanum]
MRTTLRRSCDACAKSKLSCDLRTPQCSRCIKRKSACVYANQPLTSSLSEHTTTTSPGTYAESNEEALKIVASPIKLLRDPIAGFFDPFDSYPETRLPRIHVQRLIQHFLSNIAFQYYPLDLNLSSNPFVVSWWPLALADPALFHVSLQTASLDIELHAQNGFENSELLMADSVSLVRKRIEDPTLAFQDETMDSVVTLAAIEFGKGNVEVGKMHIDGIKRMVRMRGGMQKVKMTSPLTARMVSWVSMIVMQSPQFLAQSDSGVGNGIPPIPQWNEAATSFGDDPKSSIHQLELDPTIGDILFRLRHLFHESQRFRLSNTDLHDLTCYLLHRLLLWSPPSEEFQISLDPAASECVRYAVVLYLLILQGPTYFSHTGLQYTMSQRLKVHLADFLNLPLPEHRTLALWLVAVGMTSSAETSDSAWFISQARVLAADLDLCTWDAVLCHLKDVLWLDTKHTEYLFRQQWEEMWTYRDMIAT